MSLRYVLLVILVLASVLPAVSLGIWVHGWALDREIEAAGLRQRLMVADLARTLETYATTLKDTVQVLDRTLADPDGDPAALSPLMARLEVRAALHRPADPAQPPTRAGAPAALPAALPPAPPADGQPVITEVRADGEGRPAFLVQVASRGGDTLAVVGVAALERIAGPVALGGDGHVLLVDGAGRLAYKPPFAPLIGDLRGHPLLVRMTEAGGRRGVDTQVLDLPGYPGRQVVSYAWSPAQVWGIVLPQPWQEIVARADRVRVTALGLILLGILAAVTTSWALAGLLMRPLRAVTDAARAVDRGRITVRVPEPGRLAPDELREFARAFNELATQVDQALRDQERALREASLANRAKSEFLANVSHELRTPLNAILGFSDAMHSEVLGPLPERYRDYARDIHAAGTSLLSMLDDLIDLGRAEAGMLVLEERDLDLAALTEEAAQGLAERAAMRGVALRVLPPLGSARMRGDPRRVRQIVRALVSNAIKFTNQGGSVTVGVERAGDGDLLVRVRDTGIGIPDTDIPLVMAPFGQVARAHNRQHEGAGLGLPLTVSLAELHGGRVELRSVLGQGTEAIARFPARRVRAPTVATAALAAGA